MTEKIQSVRGMRDILPPESQHWQYLERTLAEVLTGYGYQQIRTPVLEPTALFTRSIGEVSDIVQKEMYTFEDRNGDSLTMRPEGTASTVRAFIEHGLAQQLPLRLWYTGPMFRHERPQKGRYRQFHQLGIEVFGLTGPDIDAELILLTRAFWAALGIEGLTLEINSLGTAETRARYRESLKAYFEPHRARLDADSLIRLEKNPLRILDSKNPDLAELIAEAPSLTDALDDEARAHFDGLLATLTACGLEFVVNPRLVRGLDYYTHTVFEWKTTALGAQDTVCAGGRYDGLVERFGAKPVPAVGFAAGLERLLALLPPPPAELTTQADLYVVLANDDQATSMTMLEALRQALPGQRILAHCGGGSMKSQMKKADRSGARYALVIGAAELAERRYSLKPLREGLPQETFDLDTLSARLTAQAAAEENTQSE